MNTRATACPTMATAPARAPTAPARVPTAPAGVPTAPARAPTAPARAPTVRAGTPTARARGPILALALLVCLLGAPVARAQFAVIDVGAITQLISEVQLLEEQLTTARAHLAQAQQEYASMTGGRGMEQLLRGAPRNYLPTSWADLQAVMQGGGGRFGALGGGVAATVAANEVLSDHALALLPPDVRRQIDDRRRLTALQQNMTRQALLTTSDRFESLQQLIDVLPDAEDQKAVLDLQARVAAENAMLLNEQSKLLTLSQVVQSQERANQQQVSERALVGHGEFATRFQPVP